jgi:hypothetical protein
VEDTGWTWAVLILPYLDQGALYQNWVMPNGQLYGYVTLPAAVSAQTQQAMVPVYFCPSRKPNRLSVGVGGGNNNDSRDPTAGACGDYAGSLGSDTSILGTLNAGNGFFLENTFKLTFMHVTDGLSNTLCVGEKHINQNSYSNTAWDTSIYNSDSQESNQRFAGTGNLLAKSQKDPDGYIFGGPHIGSCNFAFGDGTVRSVNVTVPGNILGFLAQRNDGQSVDLSGMQ